ncbi:uncharacterized protein K02A2.6-like [Ornithodoros turicata]|uniref:uncharacterized protein K02A2.6-like n=1 Tax=Ornithodoros turicata TaxID=34597 RepID=UPI003138D0BE
MPAGGIINTISRATAMAIVRISARTVISAEPWTRIHMDYAGPIEGKMILIVVDSHSGWIEAIPVKSATAEVTVVHLRDICARFGLPTCIVTDNGTTFTGAAFQEFVKRNGIRHMRTAPYHPQSNGLAERAVRSVKEALKKLTDGPLEIRLERWLHNHRRTPSAAHGGNAPAEMLSNFLPCSRLDIIKTDVLKNQKTTQQDVDSRLKPGVPVYVRKQCDRPRWMPGIVLEGLGSRMAKVQTAQGIVTRHLDQMRTRYGADNVVSENDTAHASDPSNAAHDATDDTSESTETEGHRYSLRPRHRSHH